MDVSSLPLATRKKLGLEVREGVAEVPLTALLPPEDDKESSRTNDLVSRRPLSGNLSTKLSEYTRGVVGRRKPFRPGGMDDEGKEKGEGPAEEEEMEYRSVEETRRAREVLDKGALESWKDGTLLTAPPGVGFKVGLSPEDVYEEVHVNEKGVLKGEEAGEEKKEKEERKGEEDGGLASGGRGGRALERAEVEPAVWDRSYFDDDSLFGDSSDDEDSDEEDEEESGGDVEAGEESEGEDEGITSHSKDKPPASDTDIQEAAVATTTEATDDLALTGADDIDTLLDALTVTTSSSSTLPTKTTRVNPLLTSTSNDNDPQRKAWAVTSSLPLQNYHTLVPNPAISYPFELDPFQKQAVLRLERSECIFVAAHTSAGKTVCAEYAIALSRRHCTRTVYTSPIKALSNQKYRDFKTKFGDDVGLITGDLQVNADSTCLIMTTEILRSMLYRGADLVRDIEWVIFDEVHYVNDTERGVVWEEVIIMLPPYVNLIFLSATTPNTIEFSDWIGRTKRKPVHVIRTDYRPVPLSHHLWAGSKLHKIMEGKSGFLDKGYAEAAKSLLPASAQDAAAKGKKKGGATAGGGRGGGGGGSRPPRQQSSGRSGRGSAQSSWQQQGNRQNWTSLVKFLDREGLTPTVVFSFSKKKCEEIANMLRTLDLNTASERNAAQGFALQTTARLSPNDASLPQVLTICEMVKRGIGVHHGGLLPILKEMVEILFSRNLIKVLFATETFAMGVNMPARAVVFNSIRKHDGTEFRVLQPGEYTQMAGRAGRRGLDKVGTVIMCCFGDTPPPQTMLRNMLTGSSTKLQSQFRLTYNMILNLLRVEDMSVEGMIKRSFSEFATQRALTANEYPKLLARGLKTLAKLDSQFELEADRRVGAEDVEGYYAVCSQLLTLNRRILSFLLSSAGGTGGGALVPGRIVLVTAARRYGYVRAPAMIVRTPVLSPSSATGMATGGGTSTSSSTSGNKPAVCIVLLPESYVREEGAESIQTSKASAAKPGHLNHIGTAKKRFYAIHEIGLEEVLLVSSSKQKVDAKVLFKEDGASLPGIGGSSLNDPFARASSIGSRRSDDFAGFAPRGKKGLSTSGRTKGSSGGSQESQMFDDVISYLIEAEEREAKSSLDVLDLRDCAKGVQQGSDMLEFRSACDEMETHVSIMREFASHQHPSLEKHYATVERKETLRLKVGTLRHKLSNESLQLFPDFLQRKALLHTLGYVDENDTVCVKGRVACETNTCDELIVTEMVFEGILNELEPAEIAAALSALIFQEKSNDDELDSELPERLTSCCERMRMIAMNLGRMQKDHGLKIDPKEYCDGALKFGLVHVVYEWALGVPFSNICELTLVQEGSIVRCITRLDELCREVRNCARVVGNPTLYRKMEAASVAIKRDIVFASSLYVS